MKVNQIDRELLELAAKAVGIEIVFSGTGECYHARAENTGFRGWDRWNPLEDNGDTFCLAVKLQMDVCFGANYVIVRGSVQMPIANNAGDPYAAVRYAIVRAAAEIGKGVAQERIHDKNSRSP